MHTKRRNARPLFAAKAVAAATIAFALVTATAQPQAGAFPIDAPSSPGDVAKVPAQPTEALPPPTRVYLLVDESGSLSEEDVARERDVATALARSFPGDTELLIAGFGSSNAAGQTAVHVYCPLKLLRSSAEKNEAAACAGKIKARTDAEGNDTDFKAALQAALDAENAAPQKDGENTPPAAVMLLTDGKLDVSRSGEYGTDEASRTPGAQGQIDTVVLPAMKGKRMQVWPFGFGSVDKGALDRMAAGGFGARPDCPSASTPAAFVAGSTDEVLSTVVTNFGAGCKKVEAPVVKDCQAGQAVDMGATIPAPATYASFVVLKSDPAAKVTLVDPTGKEIGAQAEVDGQKFERSGEGTSSESFSVQLPKPGAWSAKVISPTAGRCTGILSWSGAVSTDISTTPGQPGPSEEALAEFRLRTRQDVKDAAAAVAGFSFKAVMKVGEEAPTPIAVNDAGKDGDRAAGDLVYSGKFKMPGCAEKVDVTVIGAVDAPGIRGDIRPKFFVCDPTPVPKPFATIDRLPSTLRSLTTGSTFDFDVSTSGGDDSGSESLKISVETDPKLPLKVSPSTIEGSGNKSTVTVKLGDVTDAQEVSATVKVMYGDKELASRFMSLSVEPPPTFCEKMHCSLVIGIIAAIALVVAGILWKRRRDDEKASLVNGLIATLDDPSISQFGESPLPTTPIDRHAKQWQFMIEGGQILAKDESQPEKTWTVTRGPKGKRRTHIVVIPAIGDLASPEPAFASSGSGGWGGQEAADPMQAQPIDDVWGSPDAGGFAAPAMADPFGAPAGGDPASLANAQGEQQIPYTVSLASGATLTIQNQ